LTNRYVKVFKTGPFDIKLLPNLQLPVQSRKPARHWIWVRWLSEARPSKSPASHKLLSLGNACNGVRFRDPLIS